MDIGGVAARGAEVGFDPSIGRGTVAAEAGVLAETSTAPTARTLSPSAGAVIFSQGLFPLFPAELRTSMPLVAAMSEAWVMRKVFPSSSAGLWLAAASSKSE